MPNQIPAYREMQVFIKPKSPFLTPIVADTLWGHLAWAWRYMYGENRMDEFILGETQPPLLVSDAFPEEYLPRPLLPVTVREADTLFDRRDVKKDPQKHLEEIASVKEWLNQKYLKQEQVMQVLSGARSMIDLLNDGITEIVGIRSSFKEREKTKQFMQIVSRRHNVIDRQLGGVKRKHGLYSHREYHLRTDCYWHIFVRTTLSTTTLSSLFKYVGKNGFGKRASTGLGQFSVVDIEESNNTPLFPIPAGANSFMTLSSSYVLGDGENLQDAHYQFEVRHGKIGAGWSYAQEGGFIKRPIVVFRAGSIFRTNQPGQPYFGRLLSNVHRNDQLPVFHYGYAFPVPCKI